MVKTRMLVIRITEEQEKILIERAQTAGFQKKSEYIRVRLFSD